LEWSIVKFFSQPSLYNCFFEEFLSTKRSIHALFQLFLLEKAHEYCAMTLQNALIPGAASNLFCAAVDSSLRSE
jgi:hypothetical protein